MFLQTNLSKLCSEQARCAIWTHLYANAFQIPSGSQQIVGTFQQGGRSSHAHWVQCRAGVFAFGCLTEHAGVQSASVVLCFQDLKRSWELLPSPLEDPANQLPCSKFETILTHFSFSHLRALSKGSRGDRQGEGTHQGLGRLYVIYWSGFCRRSLPEVQTGAKRITKCMEWLKC